MNKIAQMALFTLVSLMLASCNVAMTTNDFVSESIGLNISHYQNTDFNYEQKNDWTINITDELVKSVYHHRASIATKCENFVYFTYISSESLTHSSGKIFKLNLITKQIDEVIEVPGRCLAILNDILYFIDVSDNMTFKVYDTINNKFVDFPKYKVSDYCLSESSIFLIDRSEGYQRPIHDVSIKEGKLNKTLLNENDTVNLVKSAVGLYYGKMGAEFSFNYMDLTTYEKRVIYDGYYIPYGVEGNYAIMENSGPHILDMETGEVNPIDSFTDAAEISQFNFYDGHLIFSNNNGQVFLDNGKARVKISDDYIVSTFTVVGNLLFMITKNENGGASELITVIKNLQTNEIIRVNNSGVMD